MRGSCLAVLGLAAAFALTGPAGAQDAASPGTAPAGSIGSTATGGLPEKTGSTTAVGQTKPPGTAVGDGLGTRPDLERKSDELNRKINTGICTGCK